MNILEIDIGNTRIKWRRVIDGCILETGALGYSPDGLSGIWAQMGHEKPDEVRVASVASKLVGQSLQAVCEEFWGLTPRFAEVTASVSGVTNGYADPLRLGVDRWLGLLAAHRHYPQKACLVVDCGSAVTLDLLSAEGGHLGGYIVPGLQLMRRALFNDTAAVRVEHFEPEKDLCPGNSTEVAVGHGIPLMVAAFCGQVYRGMQGKGSDDVQMVVTGGDGGYLQEQFLHAVYLPELVLDGLSVCQLSGFQKIINKAH